MNENAVSLKSYVTGFILSGLLILAAYTAVTSTAASANDLVVIIFILATLQVFVQFKYFLHISIDSKSTIQLSILAFTAIGIGILVSGSLWIMYHLNYNMTPSDMNTTIMQEEGMQK